MEIITNERQKIQQVTLLVGDWGPSYDIKADYGTIKLVILF